MALEWFSLLTFVISFIKLIQDMIHPGYNVDNIASVENHVFNIG